MPPGAAPTSPRVAAIYCRVSTGAQGAEGTSLASQEALCRAHAASLGLCGARLPRGPHWRGTLGAPALRQAVRAGEVGAIVADALDRLAREQGHVSILDDGCQRAGVALLFVTEEFAQTAIGTTARSVRAFTAEPERDQIRARTTYGKRTIAASGRPHNDGPERYGYHRISEGRATRREITRRLNEDGIPPPSVGTIAYPEAGRAPCCGKAQGTLRTYAKSRQATRRKIGWPYKGRPRNVIQVSG